MKFLRHGIGMAGVLAMALGLLAACGGQDTTPVPTPTPTTIGTGGGAAATPVSSPTPTVDPERQAAEHFRGKTIRFVVAFAPGGGHDVLARVLAVHMPKYIPGSPNFIVQNMPGGRSVVAAEHVYNQRSDGLTIGVVSDVFNSWALGAARFASFDASKVGIVGKAWETGQTVSLAAVRKSSAASFEEMISRPANNPITMGTLGCCVSDGWTYFIQKNDWPIRTVPGYGGTAAALTALEAAEIDATEFFLWTTVQRQFPSLIDSSKFALALAQPPDWLACDGWPPAFMDFLRQGGWDLPRCWGDVVDLTPAERDMLKAMESTDEINSYMLFIPPNTPDWMLQVLRNALEKTTQDPQWVKDMQDRGGLPGYLSGEGVEEMLNFVSNLPQDLKDVLNLERS